jgi:hypothetical protein
MARQYRRTRFWIDTPFQSRLLLRMALYLLLYSFLTWQVGFLIDVLQCIAGGNWGKVTSDLYVDFLWRQKSMLVSMAVVTPIFVYDLIKFSHRVAGPLFRCRTLLQDMAAGKPVPEIQPRKNDLMLALLQAFNAFVRQWNTRVSRADPGPEKETEQLVESSV